MYFQFQNQPQKSGGKITLYFYSGTLPLVLRCVEYGVPTWNFNCKLSNPCKCVSAHREQINVVHYCYWYYRETNLCSIISIVYNVSRQGWVDATCVVLWKQLEFICEIIFKFDFLFTLIFLSCFELAMNI